MELGITGLSALVKRIWFPRTIAALSDVGDFLFPKGVEGREADEHTESLYFF